VDPEQIRERLEQMLAEIDGSARTLLAGHRLPSEIAEANPTDNASELSDADREEAVLEVVNRQRESIREALTRLADGSYGRCIDCGTTLPEERLDARPEAERCVRCQQQREAVR